MNRILLLGCGGSAGINYIKALRLAKEKFYIVGIDQNKFYLEMSPVNKRYLINKKDGSLEDYIKKINKIIKDEKIDFIHAQPDPEVKVLSDFRDKLNAKTFLPSKIAVDISQDKWLTYDNLKSNSVSVPLTLRIDSPKALKKAFSLINGTIWIRAKQGAGGKASLPVTNYDQAKMWIEYWVDKGLKWEDFLASEFLPGREVSWLSIWKDGKLICSQSKERKEWVQAGISPSNVAGTTAIQRTVHYQDINDLAKNTVLSVDNNPNGIYVIDAKDNKDGIPCVTEINPGRFFTTSLFFATAGVNMPLIFTQLGLDQKIKKVSQYNCVQEDIYWIRVTDGGPTMVKNNKWTSIPL